MAVKETGKIEWIIKAGAEGGFGNADPLIAQQVGGMIQSQFGQIRMRRHSMLLTEEPAEIVCVDREIALKILHTKGWICESGNDSQTQHLHIFVAMHSGKRRLQQADHGTHQVLTNRSCVGFVPC